MSVGRTAIEFMALSLALSVFVPILLFVYAYKKYQISFKTVAVGAFIWFVTTQVIEKFAHVTILNTTAIMQYPFLFALYTAATTAIFEEGGKYIAFLRFLKATRRDWKDGLGYGP